MKKSFIFVLVLLFSTSRIYSAANIVSDEKGINSHSEFLAEEFVKPLLTIKQRTDIYNEAYQLSNMGLFPEKQLENMKYLLKVLTFPRECRLKIIKAQSKILQSEQFDKLLRNVLMLTKN